MAVHSSQSPTRPHVLLLASVVYDAAQSLVLRVRWQALEEPVFISVFWVTADGRAEVLHNC